MNNDILKKAQKIKWAIFDVDGVMTDGRLYFGPNGDEHKVFYVHDGLGLKLLQRTGVTVAVISSRESPVVTQRLHNLGISHIYQGQDDKRLVFQELLKTFQLDHEQIAYVGDDLPDLPLIQQVGLGICVANAHPLLKQHAVWQTSAKGGRGAVREVCELLMEAQGTLQATYEDYCIR